MNSKDIVEMLYQQGFSPFVGVPCSLLAGIITELETRGNYISATDEGEAIAVVAGAALAGKLPVALMQNSGLGNAVNPITSLINVFGFKGLLFIGYRGYPHGTDEIQHQFMGSITEKLLNLLEIKSFRLSAENTKDTLGSAIDCVKTENKTVAILLPEGVIDKDDTVKTTNGNTLNATIVINEIFRYLTNTDTVISTTGTISRMVFDTNHRTKNFYMFGSMGCANAMGLGYSIINNDDSRIVVIDGDGAVLMKLGSMSTSSKFGKKLIHIVLDNGCYSTTGGQLSNSTFVDFEKVAKGCGYQNVFTVETVEELPKLEQAMNRTKTLVAVKINNDKPKSLPRIKLCDIDLESFAIES